MCCAGNAVLACVLFTPLAFAAPTPAPAAERQGQSQDESKRKSPQVNLDRMLYTSDGQLSAAAKTNLRTPRGSLENLLLATANGEYKQAAESLDLSELDGDVDEGALARKLHYVLTTRLDLRLEVLPDSPAGLTQDEQARQVEPRREILLTRMNIRDESIPVRLVRIDREGDAHWVFGPDTVSHIDRMYRFTGVGHLSSLIPFHILSYEWFGISLVQAVLGLVGLAVSWVGAGLLQYYGFILVVQGLRQKQVWLERFRHFLSRSVFSLLFFAALWCATQLFIGLPPEWGDVYNNLLFFGFVASATWFVNRVITMLAEVYGTQRIKRAADADVFYARSLETQLTVLRRAVNALVFLGGIGIGLSAFPWFENLGTSLLASAGVLSLLIGIGAQRTLANIFAGIQVALTQPVRIGDMVIFQDEWGYIEEITYTYVVLRRWDLQRLIVPVTKLLDDPVYNFSRGESTRYGTIYLYLDYTVPIEPLRAQFKKIVDGDENHDGEIASMLVTDCKEWSVEVRALVSAHDGLAAWYLRCRVREALIEFLRDFEGGGYLPRARIELERDGAHKQPLLAESGKKKKPKSRQKQSDEEAKGVGKRSDDG